MFARVSTFEVRPERLDEMEREGTEHVLPALRRLDGFNGGLVLTDRQSGKVLVVSLWESEQTMHRSDEASYWFRTFGAEAAGGTVTGVQTYEVFFSAVKETYS